MLSLFSNTNQIALANVAGIPQRPKAILLKSYSPNLVIKAIILLFVSLILTCQNAKLIHHISRWHLKMLHANFKRVFRIIKIGTASNFMPKRPYSIICVLEEGKSGVLIKFHKR